ncbi:MAG: aminotransferase class V-fold PLP-dependent enzyme [Parachlamydiales bacterium]|nr:aminotransferase class V-fold PLP-dependent enzyme [Parachlamydiales bacterium]
MIYLDHHSATRPCSAALERMTPYLQDRWGASFAPHKMGQELIASLDTHYQMIYDLVGAGEPDRFVFTSSGAEGINQVFLSIFLEVARKTGKTHIIVSEIEDAPTMRCAKRLEELGCTIKIAPAKDGLIDVEALAKLINPRTSLISVSMAHGLTGVIQPADEIINLAKEKNILLHLDATYAVGKYPIAFESDYLTFSGDRIHSVKGSGGLFAKEKAPLVPLILGGNEQAGYRGGSFDIPSFMALSAAASQASLYLDTMALEVARLRALFESSVQGEVLFKNHLRLPNTSLIAFKGVHQEALLYFLSRKGVYAAIGGAYAPHLSTIDETALSFSLSRMTTEEEIVKAAKIINDTVKDLQSISEAL